MARVTSTTKLAVALGLGLLALEPAWAQETAPDVRGQYRGFFQSFGDPGGRGPVALTIDFEDPAKGAFSGQLTMIDRTFAFSGKADSAGRFKGHGTGEIGTVRFEGKFDAQGIEPREPERPAGAALVRFEYSFTAATGATDAGAGDLLRDFVGDPNILPPEIGGWWAGGYQSDLAAGMGTVDLFVEQERTATGAPGTGFSGQEFVDNCTRRALTFDFVGTLDARAKIIVIGLGPAGRFIVGGIGDPNVIGDPNLKTRFTYLFNSFDRSLDLGWFEIMRTGVPPNPCAF